MTKTETDLPTLGYPFDADHRARTPDQVASLLGGKGAALAAMAAMGMPVPPGFTLTTEACRRYLDHGWDDALEAAVNNGIVTVERMTGKRLGDPSAPLVLSVRSGARTSMPGMMDTVLDLGMSDEIEAALAARTGDPTFAADTHRRALVSFAEVVRGVDRDVVARTAAAPDPAAARRILEDAGVDVPADPRAQVVSAVQAVFASWKSARAVRYRAVEGIDDSLGTAATVQAMVFGNLGERSGTGVAFTRDPSSGRPGLMGDFLTCAQGEDVVAGSHATRPLASMAAAWPDVYGELDRIADRLEQHFDDMVDIEFTVENGILWVLQARRGKRSPLATFRVAVDMAEDPRFAVTRADAVARCRHLLADPPTIDDPAESPGESPVVVATGTGASPGMATGVLCTDVEAAVRLEAEGRSAVLVRRETSPADVHGMAASVGLVTALGGLVSHAAVVARSWGIPAVVGADIELVEGGVIGPAGRVDSGTVVTVDGDRGQLLLGSHSRTGHLPDEVATVQAWASSQQEPRTSPEAVEPLRATFPTTPPPASLAPFAVLHALRIKGMSAPATISAMTTLPRDEVDRHLGALEAHDAAIFREPRSAWQITRSGQIRHADELEGLRAGLDLAALEYEAFLQLNDELKVICTDWQLRDGVGNDHGDAAYDADVVERLVKLDAAAQPVIRSFGDVLPWASPYGARLAAARARVQRGDPKALTGVLCDSYHDIWMELHEDLILTQGIDRAVEGSG